MRAVVQDGYGSPATVLSVAEVPRPEPAAGEVLVAVRATSVHPDIWHVLTGRPRVLRIMGAGLVRPSPRIPGTDMAGEVVAVGVAVTAFEPGDAVFGETISGMQWRNGGAWAQYVAVPAEWLAPMPAQLSFEQAATLPTAGLIVIANMPSRVGAGARLLVNGAAGGVGGLFVQVARGRGAHVTGVDRGDKLDLVRELGAHEVIDYTTEDFTTSGQTWDVVVDIPGNHPWARIAPVVASDGAYVLIGHDGYGTAGRTLGSIPRVMGLLVRGRRDSRIPGFDTTTPGKSDVLAELTRLVEQGHVAPVVDRTWPLEGAAAAVEHLASGAACGRVVLVPDRA